MRALLCEGFDGESERREYAEGFFMGKGFLFERSGNKGVVALFFFFRKIEKQRLSVREEEGSSFLERRFLVKR